MGQQKVNHHRFIPMRLTFLLHIFKGCDVLEKLI